MFAIYWTDEARAVRDELKAAAEASLRARGKTGKKKSSKAEGLFKQVSKAISLLANRPRHPGLHTHEYLSCEHPFEPQGKVFEAYAQNKTPCAYRVFWCYGPKKGDITIIAITPHP